MSIHPQPKGKTRKQIKGRRKRAKTLGVKQVRDYVFERERWTCRCCKEKMAKSMHEIIFRSQGGKVSKENSIAVCGDGVSGCHGKLQRHEIHVRAVDPKIGAEGVLMFQETGR